MPARDRPNIVLILNDDMGFSDIGCYGGEVQTPNLDQLADRGIRFTQAYNTARCCPSRASLMTGLHPHQTGVGHMMRDWGLDGYRGDLNDRCVTIAEALSESGYATYMSGKWHMTRFLDADGPKHSWPLQRGFDEFYGIIIGAADYFSPQTLRRGNAPAETPADDYYITDAISDQAVDYISAHNDRSPDDPFFLYTAYTAPHWPLHALPQDIDKYRGRFDAGWDVLRAERFERMKSMGIIDDAWQLTDRDPSQPPWEEAENRQWQSRRMEVYAAQIDRMDQGIGRIIEALKRSGQLDNTLILFLADNGGCAEELGPNWFGPRLTRRLAHPTTHYGDPVRFGNVPKLMPGGQDTYQSYGVPWANLSNTPFRLYKHWVHEGGIATPLIAHWPERITAPGELRHQPVQLPDIMATCLQAAGADYPAERHGTPVHPLEGYAIAPIFDNSDNGRPALVWEHEGNCAVRKNNWKLVKKFPADWELYDLRTDRTETNDRAKDHPDMVQQLDDLWQDWAQRCNVLPWSQANPSLRTDDD